MDSVKLFRELDRPGTKRVGILLYNQFQTKSRDVTRGRHTFGATILRDAQRRFRR